MKYFFLLLFSIPTFIFSQEIDDDGTELLTKCHTYEMQDDLFDQHPEIKIEAEQAAALLEDFTRNFDHKAKSRDGEPYVIPVVFHIIHNFGDENISNEQVEDCVRVMNEDFSATNFGVNSVNSLFSDLIANVGIEFRLAKLDPDGNCTNGIVRTVSPLTNSGGENLKSISPIWDRSMYMNVWVCKTIASGAAGYTYYPSTLAGDFGLTNDGIVVRSDYVGAIGTSSPQRSHTMTHEVGHWINLAHLWGSTNQPEVNSNCNTDDGVQDTPNTIGWTTCNLNGESCGSPDNVENYMEYSYCSKMFTIGQGERMIAALNSSVASRSSLWQPENLENTGVTLDAALCNVDFSASTLNVCVGETVSFTDLSFSNINSRSWSFEGGEPAISEVPNPEVLYTSPGLYAVTLTASDGVDAMTVERTGYIRVLDTATVAIPFQEGFEEIGELNLNVDDTWFTQNRTGDIDWEITSLAAYSGDFSVYVNGRENETGASEYLLSQTFDLTGVQQNAVLTFKYAHANRNFNSNDRLRVWISRNCGDFWSLRKTISGDDLPTVDQNIGGPFVPSGQEEWREVSISNIVSVFLTSEFRIRFEFTSNTGNNIYIDDINLQDASLISSADEVSETERSLNIYPNPAKDKAFIEFDQLTADRGSIALFDISGRIVKEVYLGHLASGSQRYEVELFDLTSGIYFVRIDTNTKGTITRKLVVQ